MASNEQFVEVADYSEKTYASQKRYIYLSFITITLGFLDVDPESSIFGFIFKNLDEFFVVTAFACISTIAGMYYLFRIREEHDVFSDLSKTFEGISENLKMSLNTVFEYENKLQAAVSNISEESLQSLKDKWEKKDLLPNFSEEEFSALRKDIKDLSNSESITKKYKENLREAQNKSPSEYHRYHDPLERQIKRVKELESTIQRKTDDINDRFKNFIDPMVRNLDWRLDVDRHLSSISVSIKSIEQMLSDVAISNYSRKKLASKQRLRICLFEWGLPLVLFFLIWLSVCYDYRYHQTPIC